MNNTFAAAINCIDGRVQIPVIEWIKTNYQVDYVDLITEPGPNKILSENSPPELVSNIKSRVGLSVKKHGTKVLAVAAHFDCASNKSSKETQISQVKAAINVIDSWGFNLKVIGLWVAEDLNATEV